MRRGRVDKKEMIVRLSLTRLVLGVKDVFSFKVWTFIFLNDQFLGILF